VKPSASQLFAALVAVPLAAVGAALVSQHVFGMLPCPWCVLQRLIFVCIALLALPALVLRAKLVRRIAAGLIVLLAASGVASSLWLHFVAARSQSCNMTLADRIMSGLGLDTLWPEVFAAYASCADAAVRLLGVPYEFWSLALFIALGAAAALSMQRGR
jgi:disulfide bond formation protein DsbB